MPVIQEPGGVKTKSEIQIQCSQLLYRYYLVEKSLEKKLFYIKTQNSVTHSVQVRKLND